MWRKSNRNVLMNTLLLYGSPVMLDNSFMVIMRTMVLPVHVYTLHRIQQCSFWFTSTSMNTILETDCSVEYRCVNTISSLVLVLRRDIRSVTTLRMT